MNRKEEPVLNPTPDEIAQALGGIEEATAGEPLREKWGELGNLQNALGETAKTESSAEGRDPALTEYLRKWRESHLDRQHEYKYIDPDTVQIEDLTGLEIPFDFIDDLIIGARGAIYAEGKEVKMLNNIVELKIVTFSEPYKGLRMRIKAKDERTGDPSELSILSFKAEPPFDLTEVKSTFGSYTL